MDKELVDTLDNILYLSGHLDVYFPFLIISVLQSAMGTPPPQKKILVY